MNDNLILSRNNSFNSNFYQTPLYSPNKLITSYSQKDLLNINAIQNTYNISSQSPKPFVFQVPKQNANFYLTRTPPPSQNRRNIIDLGDNGQFKETSNSPVVYPKLNSMDSITDFNQLNASPVRKISQPLDIRINDIKPIYNAPLEYISFNQKIHRLARTPEPKKNNFEIITNNQLGNYQNNNNNSYFINNISNNISNNNSSLDNILNNQQMEINHTRIISQIPQINIPRNDYLKTHNVNIRKFNDYFQNNNYNLHIKSISDYNQFIQNENNINIPSNKRINFLYKNNEYDNRIAIKKHNYNLSNDLIYKKANETNYRNYLNEINKSNIKKYNDLNQNRNYFNDININKNQNLYNNNININYTNTYNINNFYYNNYPNNISIKKPTDISNNSNSNISNNINFQKVPNDNYSNYYLSSNKNLPIANGVQNIQNIPPNVEQNHINIIPIPQNKLFLLNGNGIIKRSFKEIDTPNLVPKDDFNLSEFKIIRQIGEGTYGRIYCVKWIKNNELYALKKIVLYGEGELNSFKKKVKIVQNLTNKFGNNGLIRVYGDKSIPQRGGKEYLYYIIMELGEKDWEKELNSRKSYSSYYSEIELLQIIKQIVRTLALMQKNNVTHRDIKPQNILICKNLFKLCDFDEAKKITGNGPIIQPVRGSELYMSPILFYAYNGKIPNVLHNTYKSDVFSLGMTVLLAASLSLKPLCDIREIKNMNIISRIINKILKARYSQNLINLIINMLQIDENLRYDFIELEKYIYNIWPN